MEFKESSSDSLLKKFKGSKHDKFKQIQKSLLHPYLKKNPYVFRLFSYDGLLSPREAAHQTIRNTIELAYLIARRWKRQEGNFFDPERPLYYEKPLENRYILPLCIEFNPHHGFKVIEDYLKVRIPWMKKYLYTINFVTSNKEAYMTNYVYELTACNPRFAYPFIPTNGWRMEIYLTCLNHPDKDSRLQLKFFVEGNEIEFSANHNDHHFRRGHIRKLLNWKNNILCENRMTHKQPPVEVETSSETSSSDTYEMERKVIEPATELRPKSESSMSSFADDSDSYEDEVSLEEKEKKMTRERQKLDCLTYYTLHKLCFYGANNVCMVHRNNCHRGVCGFNKIKMNRDWTINECSKKNRWKSVTKY